MQMADHDCSCGACPLTLLTEPLSLRQIARYLPFRRSKLKVLLSRMDGAVEIGGRWMIPLRRMPVSYLQDVGLLADGCVVCGGVRPNAPQCDGSSLRERSNNAY